MRLTSRPLLTLAAIIVAGLVVTGCDVVRRAQPPTITGQVPTWQGPTTPKVLTARIGGNMAFWEVRGVFVRYARHGWPPTLIEARHGDAVQDTGDPTLWRFTLPAPEDFQDGFAVFFQWFVEYALPDGNDIATVSDTVRSFRVTCDTGGTARNLLRDQQRILGAFDVPNPQIALAPLGYAPSHGFVSFNGNGVTFAKVLTMDGPPRIGEPQVLMYAPTPGNISRIAEPFVADPPYTLIGWGYTARYVPGQIPFFFCFPAESWFVHEAGWHTLDGGFDATPPPEATPGAAPAPATPPTINIGAWHTRFWDIHLWVNRAGGLPGIGVLNPTGAPTGGTPLPGNAFFTPPLTP